MLYNGWGQYRGFGGNICAVQGVGAIYVVLWWWNGWGGSTCAV